MKNNIDKIKKTIEELKLYVIDGTGYNPIFMQYKNGVYERVLRSDLEWNRILLESFLNNVTNYDYSDILKTRAMVEASLPKISFGPHDVLCFNNGVFNMERNEASAHSPDYYCTARINCDAETDSGKKPVWDKFFENLDTNSKMRMQEFLAYLLLGQSRFSTSEPRLDIIRGSGRGVILNMLLKLFGDNTLYTGVPHHVTDETFRDKTMWIMPYISDLTIHDTSIIYSVLCKKQSYFCDNIPVVIFAKSTPSTSLPNSVINVPSMPEIPEAEYSYIVHSILPTVRKLNEDRSFHTETVKKKNVPTIPSGVSHKIILSEKTATEVSDMFVSSHISKDVDLSFTPVYQVYEIFLQWCENMKIKDIPTLIVFNKSIRKQKFNSKPVELVEGEGKIQCWVNLICAGIDGSSPDLSVMNKKDEDEIMQEELENINKEKQSKNVDESQTGEEDAIIEEKEHVDNDDDDSGDENIKERQVEETESTIQQVDSTIQEESKEETSDNNHDYKIRPKSIDMYDDDDDDDGLWGIGLGDNTPPSPTPHARVQSETVHVKPKITKKVVEEKPQEIKQEKTEPTVNNDVTTDTATENNETESVQDDIKQSEETTKVEETTSTEEPEADEQSETEQEDDIDQDLVIEEIPDTVMEEEEVKEVVEGYVESPGGFGVTDNDSDLDIKPI